MRTDQSHENWKRNRELSEVGKQRCPKCEGELAVDEFNPSDRGRAGAYCTVCKREHNSRSYETKWKALNPDLHRARTYGMKPAEYRRMRREQGESCAVCGCALGDLAPKLIHVDHDHVTGDARGVLCFRCNVLVGAARDSVEILEKIDGYLRKHMAK